MRRMSWLLSLLIAMFLVPLSSAAAEGVATCQGQPATIEGSKGTVRGTAGDDVIVATGKARRVVAGDGDDLICLVGTRSWPDPDFPDDPAHDWGTGVDDGPGDDVVDASEAGGRTAIVLGPGADSFVGGRFGDVVAASSYDGTGPYEVRTGAGRDELIVGPGVVIDARLGRGQDVLRSQSSPVGFVDPRSVFDLGAGRDVAFLSDDWESDDAGETSLLVDLAHEVVTWHDVTVTMRDVENAGGWAERVRMIGNQERNRFYGHGCDVDLRGGRGADRLTLSGSAEKTIAPTLSSCRPTTRLRARGERGNDFLEGGRRHDVLLGGRGHDKAHGGPAGHDRCQAEIIAGKGCLR